MAWMKQTCTDFIDTIDKISDFLILGFEAGTPAAGGGNTGNGEMKGASANLSAVAETWTITLTSATAFTVSGSVSGSQAAGVVNTPYSNAYTSFTIVAGSTAFVSSDSFTCAITSQTSPWTAERAIAGNLTDTVPEYIWKSTGSGSEEIYVGLQGASDFSTYYNFRVQGFTGYNAANDFDQQLGYYNKPFWTGSAGAHTLYVWKTAQMFRAVAILGTLYAEMTAGFVDVLGADSQLPYPMFAAGNSESLTGTIAATANDSSWWVGDSSSNCPCYFNYNGTIVTFDNDIWPLMDNQYRIPYIKEYLFDTDYRELFPVILVDLTYSRTYGQVVGMVIPPDQASAIGVADTLIDGDLNAYLVIQNNGQSGVMHTAAIRLD